MLTIFLITRNRDEGLKKCLNSVVKNMTGEYEVIVGNCSDDTGTTQRVIQDYPFDCINMKPSTPIHVAYNTLISMVKTPFMTYLADDIVLEQDLTPLIPFLKDHDVVGLPMKDVIKYPHSRLPVDEYGCVNNHHKGKRFINHWLVETKVWQHRLDTKSDEQLDLFVLHRYKNVYWPQGLYLVHTRVYDKTRINRIL